MAALEHLLLTLYRDFTRRQRDYHRGRVYTAPGDEGCDNEDYMHTAPANRAPYIHIVSYKTSKTYGTFQEDLPADLLASVAASLARQPREYPFVRPSGKHSGERHNENTYGKWSNAQLKQLFDNPLTTTGTLRHSKSENINVVPGIIYAQRVPEASRMAHSVSMQLMYDLSRGPEHHNTAPPPAHAPPPPPSVAEDLAEVACEVQRMCTGAASHLAAWWGAAA